VNEQNVQQEKDLYKDLEDYYFHVMIQSGDETLSHLTGIH